MIKAVLLSLALASPAQAGAWEEFEQRCLVPMENVEVPIREGLDLDLHISGRLPGREFYFFPRDTFARLTFEVRWRKDRTVSMCTVGVWDGASHEFSNQLSAGFRNWYRAVIAAGAYVASTDDSRYEAVELETIAETHLAREPVMTVALWRHGPEESWNVTAWETDRES